MAEQVQNLMQLCKNWCGLEPQSVSKLPGSGSYRSYFRLKGDFGSVIGAHNGDIRENTAFISFTEHFRGEGLPVPEIFAIDPAKEIYLLTDLGDTTLYQFLTEKRAAATSDQVNFLKNDPGMQIPAEVSDIYKKAISWLPLFQVKAGKTLDYSVCYPRAAFDRQSMMWDLNYFKYYFLKLAKIPFDEQALENDFTRLCDLLLKSESDFFLFRDFQSRNIMVLNNEPWFIDYQGGRRGALQYDIASLLTDGKANIPMEDRKEMLRFYLSKLEEVYPIDHEKFLKTYDGFALIRILQALGAYGFRGYYENKPHFLQSIPYAVRNLQYFRTHNLIGFGLKTLMSVIDSIVKNPLFYNQQTVEVNESISNNNKDLNKFEKSDFSKNLLTVTIYSFSYKKSVPPDENGNGGGFIFDCRALPNPGRIDEYKQLNGKDQPVIDYLKRESAVVEFISHACALIDQSVRTYMDREFDHLMVSFGCTGGQHRSVYCAEALARYLKDNHKINIILTHLQLLNHLNT